ncbi:MAG: AraC family transcriptional regulator [Clostridiaceae bacterium]
MDAASCNYHVSVDYFIDRQCTPSWCITQNAISFHDLTWVLSGESTYFIDGVPYHLTGGDVVYIPKGSMREAFTSVQNPMHCYAFNFQCRIDGTDCRKLPFPLKFKVEFPSSLLDLYRHFNKIWLERSPGYTLEASAILMLIIYRYLRMVQCSPGFSSYRDMRTESIKEYIANHFDAKIDMKLLAGLYNLHPAYLGAYFKKNAGISIHEYINKIRIQKAEDLLAMGECTVSEAAVRCGFEDIFYFSKVFSKIKGRPPSSVLNSRL